MALATLQVPFSLISGKMANPVNNSGVVAMPTAQRNVLRQMVVPANPDTTRQTEVRAIFTTNAIAFAALSTGDYNSWNTLATSYKRNGRLDLEYTLSGIGIYNAVNFYRLANGQSATATAPTYATPGAPLLDGAYVDTADIVISVDTTGMPAGQLLAIRITGPLPGNRRAQRNNVRFNPAEAIAGSIQASTANANQSFTLNGAATALGISVNDRIGVLLQPLTTDYQPGVAQFTNSIIAQSL